VVVWRGAEKPSLVSAYIVSNGAAFTDIWLSRCEVRFQVNCRGVVSLSIVIPWSPAVVCEAGLQLLLPYTRSPCCETSLGYSRSFYLFEGLGKNSQYSAAIPPSFFRTGSTGRTGPCLRSVSVIGFALVLDQKETT